MSQREKGNSSIGCMIAVMGLLGCELCVFLSWANFNGNSIKGGPNEQLKWSQKTEKNLAVTMRRSGSATSTDLSLGLLPCGIDDNDKAILESPASCEQRKKGYQRERNDNTRRGGFFALAAAASFACLIAGRMLEKSASARSNSLNL